MRNPFAEWINRKFPTRPSLPRSIELKAGDHAYIVLYDQNQLSSASMAATCDRLHRQGINTIFVGCNDPVRDMTYLEVKVPSPQAVDGE